MNTTHFCPSGRREQASAVVAVLMILGLISLYSVATAQRMYSLKRDLRLIEQKQLLKFRPAPAFTNRVDQTGPGFQK